MVRDYVTHLYEPTAATADAQRADGHARAKALAGWKASVRRQWDRIHITSITSSDEVADLGAAREVTVLVDPNGLSPTELDVQLVHGRVLQHGELEVLSTSSLTCTDATARPVVYQGTVPCDTPGRYGFTVRVVPTHPDLVHPLDLGLLTWAE